MRKMIRTCVLTAGVGFVTIAGCQSTDDPVAAGLPGPNIDEALAVALQDYLGGPTQAGAVERIDDALNGVFARYEDLSDAYKLLDNTLVGIIKTESDLIALLKAEAEMPRVIIDESGLTGSTPSRSTVAGTRSVSKHDVGAYYYEVDCEFSDVINSDLVVLYINGIRTTSLHFRGDLEAVRRLVSAKLPNATVIGYYNLSGLDPNRSTTGGFCSTLISSGFAAAVSSSQIYPQFAAMIHGWCSEVAGSSVDFVEALNQWMQIGVTGTPSTSVDIERVADLVQQLVGNGKRVIVIPHSQGNLIAQQALGVLRERANHGQFPIAADEIFQAIGVIGVASPTPYWVAAPAGFSIFVSHCLDPVAGLRFVFQERECYISPLRDSLGNGSLGNMVEEFFDGLLVHHSFVGAYLHRNATARGAIEEALVRFSGLLRNPLTDSREGMVRLEWASANDPFNGVSVRNGMYQATNAVSGDSEGPIGRSMKPMKVWATTPTECSFNREDRMLSTRTQVNGSSLFWVDGGEGDFSTNFIFNRGVQGGSPETNELDGNCFSSLTAQAAFGAKYSVILPPGRSLRIRTDVHRASGTADVAYYRFQVISPDLPMIHEVACGSLGLESECVDEPEENREPEELELIELTHREVRLARQFISNEENNEDQLNGCLPVEVNLVGEVEVTFAEYGNKESDFWVSWSVAIE